MVGEGVFGWLDVFPRANRLRRLPLAVLGNLISVAWCLTVSILYQSVASLFTIWFFCIYAPSYIVMVNSYCWYVSLYGAHPPSWKYGVISRA